MIMKFLPYQCVSQVTCLVLFAIVNALPAKPVANSGGGWTEIGTLKNFGSIGHPFMTTRTTVGSQQNESGQVVYILHSKDTLVGPDGDSDGIPDSFEALYGLDASKDDASLDPDGDGSSNYEEYLAGTDPTDRTSNFAFTLLQQVGEDFRLTWNTVVGKIYYVQTSETLKPDSWQTVTTVVATGLSETWTDNELPAPKPYKFYRITIQQ
jgi:hypothetical protein